MAFGIETNTERADAGLLTGRLEAIACDCWFTSGGQTMPRMIKYQDGEGSVHTVSEILVERAEKKYRCGIPVMEYCCRARIGAQEAQFVLIFYLEDCVWKIRAQG